MQWVLLGVIAIALVIMSGRYPKAAFSLMALLVGMIAILFYTSSDKGYLSRSQLATSDVTIENPVMTPAYADSYRLNARLVNNHETAKLEEVVVSITMSDCPEDNEKNCQVIGQSEERINIKIPPGQARDIARTVSFYAPSPEAFIKWAYKVTNTRS